MVKKAVHSPPSKVDSIFGYLNAVLLTPPVKTNLILDYGEKRANGFRTLVREIITGCFGSRALLVKYLNHRVHFSLFFS